MIYVPTEFAHSWMLDEYMFQNRKWTWKELEYELQRAERCEGDSYLRTIVAAKYAHEKNKCEELYNRETDPVKRTMIEELMDEGLYHKVLEAVYGKPTHEMI